MSGKVVHFEIPADDLDRARGFYREVFGWRVDEVPGLGYTMAVTTPTDDQGMPSDPGAINGGMFQREDSVPTPVITIDVEDIDKTVEQITALGGSLVRPKEAVGDMGFAAYFHDSEGNLMGLWQTAG